MASGTTYVVGLEGVAWLPSPTRPSTVWDTQAVQIQVEAEVGGASMVNMVALEAQGLRCSGLCTRCLVRQGLMLTLIIPRAPTATLVPSLGVGMSRPAPTAALGCLPHYRGLPTVANVRQITTVMQVRRPRVQMEPTHGLVLKMPASASVHSMPPLWMV